MAATTGTPLDFVLSGLGDEELTQRAAPTWQTALMGTAGALIGIGLAGISDKRGIIILLGFVLIAAAYAAMMFWPFGDSKFLRPAAMGMITVGIVGIAFNLLSDDTVSIVVPAIVVTVLAAAGWAVGPGTKGRPWLLGMALVGIWYLLLEIVGDVENPVFAIGGALGGSPSIPSVGGNGVAVTSMIFGGLLFAAVWFCDKQGWPAALGTPAAAVGAAAFVVGAARSAGSGGVGTVAVIIGAAILVVGAMGGWRRVSTWVGAAGMFLGFGSWVDAIGGDSRVANGLLFAVIGLILAAVAFFLNDPQRRAQLGAKMNTDAVAGDAAPAAFGAAATPAAAAPAAAATAAAAQPGGGWYADPTSRFEQRWWDGAKWTSRVRTGLSEHDDPLA